MASPVDSFTQSFRCSGNAPVGLIAKMKVNVAALTAANFNAQIAAVAALSTAALGLSTATNAGTSTAIDTASAALYPLAVANRGQKWIISASDANGRKYTYTIPAADPTGNLQADDYSANLASTAWAAFVTAFQAVATNPNAASLTVNAAKLGGRRR